MKIIVLLFFKFWVFEREREIEILLTLKLELMLELVGPLFVILEDEANLPKVIRASFPSLFSVQFSSDPISPVQFTSVQFSLVQFSFILL